jgi:MFS transporter, MFS domain-containing protein family, molybdate-anion transporter
MIKSIIDGVVSLLQSTESSLVQHLNWPHWALRTIAALFAVVIFLFILEYIASSPQPKVSSHSKNGAQSAKVTSSFRWFQVQYISVYLIVMLADWLQGTNMYTLYASYKVNIGTLFITGFLSSAIFGTFLGVYVDRWGRRLGCIIFCVLEIVINVMEHVPSMPVLMAGRILGGLSTSLLFSTFESWMVSEHRKRGFSEDLLTSTFGITSWGNGGKLFQKIFRPCN